MQASPLFKQARRGWRLVFVLYGPLSLSFMAGMGVGSALFLAASLWYFAGCWSAGGRDRLREAYSSPYTWLSIGFFLACLLSLLAAALFPVEGSQQGPLLSSLKKFHYFLYPPLFALAFLGEDGRIEDHPFWKAWAGMGAFLSVVAALQFFGADLFPDRWLHNDFFRQTGGTNRFHGQGLMLFHLSFASCMSFVASVAWARLFFPRRGDGRTQRVAWGALALLSSLGVYFSYSRIALGALAALLLLLGFLRRPRLGLAMIPVLGLVSWAVWAFSPSLQARFALNVGGTFERKVMWESALMMFRDRPLTGVGFSRTGELSPFYGTRLLGVRPDFTSHAHDNFLDMLAATGFLGTAFFLAWWAFLFYAAGSAFRRAPPEERWLPAAVLAGFLAFHGNGITQVNFWDGKSEHTLMLFAGLALALRLRARKARLA